MVKVERSFPVPESLAEEARKANGKYDRQDVIERLKRDFHNKCYICEMKKLQDPNVEHLLPHKNGKYLERKFNWENLFGHVGIVMGLRITISMMRELLTAVNKTLRSTCISIL